MLTFFGSERHEANVMLILRKRAPVKKKISMITTMTKMLCKYFCYSILKLQCFLVCFFFLNEIFHSLTLLSSNMINELFPIFYVTIYRTTEKPSEPEKKIDEHPHRHHHGDETVCINSEAIHFGFCSFQ